MSLITGLILLFVEDLGGWLLPLVVLTPLLSGLIGGVTVVAWMEMVTRMVPEKVRAAGWSARYIGSLVGDFHRNLVKGGVFLYPPTEKAPKGKLRLLSEAFPLAYLVENAGGAASDGTMAILDKTPASIHERTTLFIGDRDNVEEIVRALNT